MLKKAVEVDATVAREGMEFGVVSREIAVGGQLLTLRGLGGEYDNIFLPLYGAHQAHNAAVALAAVEAFFGIGAEQARSLDVEAVRTGVPLGALAGPSGGRAVQPHRRPGRGAQPGRRPRRRRGVSEAFSFCRLIGVVGASDGKDVRGLLEAFEPIFAEIVVTQNSSPRAMDADALAAVAVEVFGDERVQVEPRLDDALEAAITLAEEEAEYAGAGVLVTGSVITVGEARLLLGRR